MPEMSPDSFVIEHKPIGWFPLHEIAKGDVGVVFKVTDADGRVEAAMKVEKIGTNSKVANMEKNVLHAMRDEPNALHLIDYCNVGPVKCTVMTLAGPDFAVVKNLVNQKFSDATLIRVAISSLLAIKTLHEHGYLHRDIEPANLALSYNSNNRNIFLLDFGCARQYAKKNEQGKWVIRQPREKINKWRMVRKKAKKWNGG
uniref:Protein kinase domain-containing protein n=1 Tax=Caenorhabditis japonica TaxID=281687 RepID=A0A8R1E9G6_CAEJA